MSPDVAFRLAWWVLAAITLGSCSFWSSGDPVFTGADSEMIECPELVNDDFVCVRVFSDVDGTSQGTGSCVLYALGSSTPIAVAASGELDLLPGSVVEWEVVAPARNSMPSGPAPSQSTRSGPSWRVTVCW